MKQLFRLKRILKGIIFVELFFSAVFFAYFAILWMLPRYHVNIKLVLIGILVSILVISLSSLICYIFYKLSYYKFEKKNFNLLFVNHEPELALEQVQNDLSIHTYLTHSNIEESILKSALFHFFIGNFEQAKLIINQIDDKSFDNNKRKNDWLILYKKLDLLMSAFSFDKDDYLLKYTNLNHTLSMHPELHINFPNQKLDQILKIIYNIYNIEAKNDVATYMESLDIKDNFVKYTVILFLIYNDYKIPTYLKDQYNTRLNSLFVNLEI